MCLWLPSKFALLPFPRSIPIQPSCLACECNIRSSGIQHTTTAGIAGTRVKSAVFCWYQTRARSRRATTTRSPIPLQTRVVCTISSNTHAYTRGTIQYLCYVASNRCVVLVVVPRVLMCSCKHHHHQQPLHSTAQTLTDAVRVCACNVHSAQRNKRQTAVPSVARARNACSVDHLTPNTSDRVESSCVVRACRLLLARSVAAKETAQFCSRARACITLLGHRCAFE